MVLIRRPKGTWHEPESSKFDSEKALQDLVRLSPTLLPGGDELAVVAELSIPGVGFVDLVGVGSDGRIVIVECKLRANPEIRREVVGQVLSYAGGLWRMSYDSFESAFWARAGMSIYAMVKQETATELDESQLRESVTDNLAKGSFRLVVAVDEITTELRTIIEFLNEHTRENVQVLALELRYSSDGDVELLNPVVYGEEAAEKKARAMSGTKWTEASFDEAMKQRVGDPELAILKRLLDHGQKHGHHRFYGSGAMPGMSCSYSIDGVPTSVWALYLHDNGPRVALSLGSIQAKGSPERAMKWVNELRSDATFNGLLASITTDDLHKYPQFPVKFLLAEGPQEVFFKSLDDFGS